MITVTEQQKELADSLGKMFSFAVDILDFDSKYFLSMLTETGTSKLIESGNFPCDNISIYTMVKKVVYEMAYIKITEPFKYDVGSDAFKLGFIYCLYQQSTGQSYAEIEQIINSL